MSFFSLWLFWCTVYFIGVIVTGTAVMLRLIARKEYDQYIEKHMWSERRKLASVIAVTWPVSLFIGTVWGIGSCVFNFIGTVAQRVAQPISEWVGRREARKLLWHDDLKNFNETRVP